MVFIEKLGCDDDTGPRGLRGEGRRMTDEGHDRHRREGEEPLEIGELGDQRRKIPDWVGSDCSQGVGWTAM